MSVGDATEEGEEDEEDENGEEDEDVSGWQARKPISAPLTTTRAARMVDRVRPAAVRAGSL